MGTLNFPGLATGIDTSTLINQLMAINSRRLATYKVKNVAMQEKSTAYDELKTKVSEFKSASAALADAKNLEIFSSTTSDGNRLGIAATEEANPGSHSVIINQMATSETWIQDTSSFQYETDYVGAGTFIYSYNYQERVITATSTTTLEDLVGLINNDEKNPGVTASLLYQGGKYRLMFSGQETGEDYQIAINSSSTEVWKPDANQANATFTEDTENATLKTKIIDLDQWSSPTRTGAETLTISGKDHSGNTILPSRGLTISNDTTLAHLIEEINYYFEGVATATLENGQIVLTDHTSGTSSLQIGLAYNANGSSATLGLPTMAVSTEGGGTTATITALAPAKFVQTQQAQNAEIQIDNYTPTQVAEVQTLTPNAAATGGTFTLSFGGQTTSALAYNASVGSIQTALNALSTVSAAGGVTVAGSPLSTDPAASMTVTFATSAGNVGMVSINTGSLTGPTSVTVSETTRGSNDQWISRNSNVITDALTGMTLILQDVNDTDDAGDPIPINVTVSRNNSAVKSKVDKLVSTYNTLLTYLKEKTEYNDTTKTMGMFSSDLAVSLIKTQMKEPFVGVVSGFSSEDAYTQASDIGLTFDGSGNLKLNADTFNTAIKDNYQDVIDLLGAAGMGNTNSTSIEFSNASDLYTTAGQYEVQVTVAKVEGSKVITSAQIRSPGETDWRDMTIDGNLIIGNDTFDSTGYNPIYPENGLYLQVDLSITGTFTATVNVKKGFTGRLDEVLQDIIETGGRLDVSKGILDGQITQMDRKISNEQTRLDKVQTRLEQKYARLEKTITEWQRQLNAINTMSSVTS